MTIHIPAYHIKEELFRSARTLIYRALRESDQSHVIIKTLSNDYPTNHDITRFKHEFHITYLAAQSWIIYQDDTWVRVLSFMKENKQIDEGDRKGMYSTGLLSQTGENTLVLFFSGRQHAGENIDRLLALREDHQGSFIKMSDHSTPTILRSNQKK